MLLVDKHSVLVAVFPVSHGCERLSQAIPASPTSQIAGKQAGFLLSVTIASVRVILGRRSPRDRTRLVEMDSARFDSLLDLANLASGDDWLEGPGWTILSSPCTAL